jgi:phospholipid/cholesterol/gamma-HCH transport system substrate-binding protein
MKLKREIKIGIFAVATIVVMYWLVNFLKGRDLLNAYDTYYARYENVEGLTQSSPVFLQGLKVGSISKITFEQDAHIFIVAMRITRNYTIPDNSVAEIFGVDIMGNKAMRIVMGDSPTPAPPNEFLKSNVESDITTSVANGLAPIKNKLDTLLTHLNMTVQAVNSILNEERQRELEESIRHLNKTLQHAEHIAGMIDANKKHLQNTLENMDAFTASLRDNTQNIDAIIGNFAQFSDSLKQTNIKGTVEHVNTLLTQASDTSGTVGQLLYNAELYQRFSATLNDLDLLLQDLKEHPKKYVKLSLF